MVLLVQQVLISILVRKLAVITFKKCPGAMAVFAKAMTTGENARKNRYSGVQVGSPLTCYSLNIRQPEIIVEIKD